MKQLLALFVIAAALFAGAANADLTAAQRVTFATAINSDKD